MPVNEGLRPGSKIFPVGDRASQRAIADLYPRGANSREVALSNLTQELDIMKNHYEFTLRFMVETTMRMLKRGKHADPGMQLMHRAARIEAQTKRTLLPAITGDQLNEYKKQMRMAADPFRSTRTDDDYLVLKFQAEERAMVNQLKGNYELRMNRSDIEMGCALMWDFLKVAPTLPKTGSRV